MVSVQENTTLSIQVVLPDKRTVAVDADCNDTVERFIGNCCRSTGADLAFSKQSRSRLAIVNSDEYGLCYHLKNEGLQKEGGKRIKKKFNRQNEDVYQWLNLESAIKQWYNTVDSESQILHLKRRYFYSDRNIDKDEPKELCFLYWHCKEQLLRGDFPVPIDCAIDLAALQCQAELGECDATYEISKFKGYLPEEFTGTRGIEKRVHSAYLKLSGKLQVDSQFDFVLQCQKFPLYGYTMFPIKERVKDKRKMISRILAISKDSVSRVDVKTRTIVQSWPLTHIRRWGSSNVTFTLDLGDYADSLYIVQTSDGSQIGDLISGYIRITIKKKRPSGPIVALACSTSTPIPPVCSEEVVVPQKEPIIHETLPRANKVVETELTEENPITTLSSGNTQEKRLSVEIGPSLPGEGTQASSAHIQTPLASISNNAVESNQSVTSMTLEDLLVIPESLLAECRQLLIAGGTATKKSIENLESESDSCGLFSSPGQHQYVLSRLCSLARQCSRIACSYLNQASPQWINDAGLCVFIASINARDLICDIGDGLFPSSIGYCSNPPGCSDQQQQGYVSSADEVRNLLDQLLCNLEAIIAGMTSSSLDFVENAQKIIRNAGDAGFACLEVYQRLCIKSCARSLGSDTTQSSGGMIPRTKAVAADVASLVVQAQQAASGSSGGDIIPIATRCALYASQLLAVVKASQLTRASLRSREQVSKCIDKLVRSIEDLAVLCGPNVPDRDLYRCVMEALKFLKELAYQKYTDPESTDAQHCLQVILTLMDSTLRYSVENPSMLRSYSKESAEAVTQLMFIVVQQMDQFRLESLQAKKNSQQPVSSSAHCDLLQMDYDALSDALCQFQMAVNAFENCPNNSDNILFACDNLSAAAVRAANWSLSRPILLEANRSINEALETAIQVLASATAWHSPLLGEHVGKHISILGDLVQELVAAMNNASNVESLVNRVHVIFVADDFHTRCTCLLSDISIFNIKTVTIADHLAMERLLLYLDDLKCVLGEMRLHLDHLTRMYCPSFAMDQLRTIRALSRDLDLGEFYCLPNKTAASTVNAQPITDRVDQFTLSFQIAVGEIARICNQCSSERTNENALSSCVVANCRQLPQFLIDLVRSVRRLLVPLRNENESRGCHDTADMPLIQPKYRQFLIGSVKNLLEIAFIVLCAAGNLLSWQDSNVFTLRNRYQLCTITTRAIFEEAKNDAVETLQRSFSALPHFAEMLECVRQLARSANRILAQRAQLTVPEALNGFNSYLVSLCDINREINSLCTSARALLLGVKWKSTAQLVCAYRDFARDVERLMESAMNFVVFLKLRKIHTAAIHFVNLSRGYLTHLPDQMQSDGGGLDVLENHQSSYRQLLRKVRELTFLILSVSPGQSVYEYTLSRLRYARELSFKIMSPFNNMTLVESNDQVIQHSKELGEFVNRIAESAKSKQPLDNRLISECIQTAASSALGLVEGSTQAAYLIAIAPNQSNLPEGQPSVFDQVVFVKSREAIIAALHSFTDPSNSQFESHLTNVVEFSIILSDASREAACRVQSNESAASYFLHRSSDVAAELCQIVHLVLDEPDNWLGEEIRVHVQRLESCVEAIHMYATSKRFSVIPSPISLQGREAQRPIVVAICQIIDGTIGMIESLHQLIESRRTMPSDRTIWQMLSANTHNISDGIKALVVGIRCAVPGEQVCQFALGQLRQLIDSTQNSSFRTVSLPYSGESSLKRSHGHRFDKDTATHYVDSLIYDAMCLGDLVEQISAVISCDLPSTALNDNGGVVGNLISQFVLAEESLLHNVLCLARMESPKRSQLLTDKALESSETAFKYIASVRLCLDGRSLKVDSIEKLRQSFREVNDDLLNIVVTNNESANNESQKVLQECDSKEGTSSVSKTTLADPQYLPNFDLSTARENWSSLCKDMESSKPSVSWDVKSAGHHSPIATQPRHDNSSLTATSTQNRPGRLYSISAETENIYETARSLVENTRNLVQKSSVSVEISQPAMDAIEKLTGLLSLSDANDPRANQDELLDAVRRVSEALSSLIEYISSQPDLLSNADLDTLRQTTSDYHPASRGKAH